MVLRKFTVVQTFGQSVFLWSATACRRFVTELLYGDAELSREAYRHINARFNKATAGRRTPK